MRRVISSELMKLRTTNMWWIMLICSLTVAALSLTAFSLGAHDALRHHTPGLPPPGPTGGPDGSPDPVAEEAARYSQAHSAAALASTAAGLYTSGKFLGGLFVTLLGILIVTNEFYHQTATSTFLVTPRRSVVIAGKFVTAVLVGTAFWAITAVLNVTVSTIFLASEGVPNSIGTWEVTRTVLLTLAAYAVWTVFGVGLGVLIRSQVGTIVTATVLYLVSLPATFLIFGLIQAYVIKKTWVSTAQVAVPAIASLVMTSTGRVFDHAPPQWVGAVVLVGYAVVFGAVGTMIMRRRDIS